MTKPSHLAIILMTAAGAAFALPFGPGPGYSGAPGDTTCVACHGGRENTNGGSVSISFGGATNYTPGLTVHATVKISDAGQRRWGFEASPRLVSDPQNSRAGTLVSINGNTQVVPPSGSIQWIEHTLAGTRNGTANSITFEFDWTPPASNLGDVIFYVAANAANGDNTSSGDHIYTTTAKLTAAAAAARPAIAQSGVLNGADFGTTIAPGSWFAIFGSNFGSTTRLWTGNDIVDGKLPESLDGVRVTVNGKPAAIYFISPTQINAQAPDDDGTGIVSVVVTTPDGASDPVTVMLQKEAPALFAFTPQSSRYPAAVSADGAFLGPPELFGTSVTTRPARPGETIVLFGNGFGPTDPFVPAGQAFSGAAHLAGSVAVSIGGVNADVAFAGLSATSLYQFNVTVPPGLPAGDQKISISINGKQTQDTLFLAVQP